jgi:sterol desaturase/sphingolipid hydroxylase (fatty acid hydroxylase superfamily)
MSPDGLVVLRSLFALAALCAAVTVQRFCPHSGSKGSTRTNVALFVVGTAVTGLACGACAFDVAIRTRAAGVGLLAIMSLPVWIEAAMTIALLDLVSYGWHRANHSMPFLWRFHRVHHSDARFTVSTGLRFHPGELLASLPIRLVAIALVGAAPMSVLAYESFFAAANLFEHGDISIPPAWERWAGSVLVLPAHHRRHHSQAPADLARNFGTIFILWDRCLGTFRAAASAERVEVGLPGGESCDEIGRALWMPLEAVSLPLANGRAVRSD